MADPLSQGDDALSVGAPMQVAIADKPLPPSGDFPVGKTPPSRFLDWMPAPRSLPEPRAVPEPLGVKAEPVGNKREPATSVARQPFAEGSKAITEALDSMHAQEGGNKWVKTPEGGYGMYLRLRPNSIDIANIDFEIKGTGAFRHYLDHIENEAQRLGVPIINVENIFNKQLIGFLQSRGFVVTRPRPPMTMTKYTPRPRQSSGDDE